MHLLKTFKIFKVFVKHSVRLHYSFNPFLGFKFTVYSACQVTCFLPPWIYYHTNTRSTTCAIGSKYLKLMLANYISYNSYL